MALDVERLIIEATKSTRCWRLEVVQRLWSDYGRILRYGLEGGDRSSLIVKQISPPEEAAHPRGWNTDRSHLRKLRSYEVESAWYEDYSRRCGAGCRVPQCLSIEREGDEILFLLEDSSTSDSSKAGHERNPAYSISWKIIFLLIYIDIGVYSPFMRSHGLTVIIIKSGIYN